MTITSAQWWSRDNYRLSYVEDGVTKKTRSDKPEYAIVLQAIPSPDPYVYPDLDENDKKGSVTQEFWRRVAAHFGVEVDRAKTHMLITGTIPAEVSALWTKATALMDGGVLKQADVESDGNWQ